MKAQLSIVALIALCSVACTKVRAQEALSGVMIPETEATYVVADHEGATTFVTVDGQMVTVNLDNATAASISASATTAAGHATCRKNEGEALSCELRVLPATEGGEVAKYELTGEVAAQLTSSIPQSAKVEGPGDAVLALAAVQITCGQAEGAAPVCKLAIEE